MFRIEDEGSMFLQNVDICLQVHTALLLRRLTLTCELDLKGLYFTLLCQLRGYV
jgi:hypothetical protein